MSEVLRSVGMNTAQVAARAGFTRRRLPLRSSVSAISCHGPIWRRSIPTVVNTSHGPRLLAAILLVFAVTAVPNALAQNQKQSSQEGEDPESPIERTLARDLQTATVRELLDWAQSLGLSTRGTRQEVENRILEYYDVPRQRAGDREERERSEDTTVVAVQEAASSQFYSLEEVDEEYVRFTGGVVLTLRRGEAQHTIEAQEVVVNNTTNTISAEGDVEYRLETGDSTEVFRGDSLQFQLENWSGVFLMGRTETSSTTGSGATEMDFVVEGRRITRSPNEVVVVERGTLTSSQADPPNYQISARRIWLLQPGEWGLSSAVLSVGRVPVFYLPFFFLPGDKLFFHPSIGSDPRKGSYVQTTTYIFGQSPEVDPPISILQLAEPDEEEVRVIDGMFLRKPEEPVEPSQPKWVVKTMADVYTTLGLYLGIDGDTPDLGPVSTLDWRLGVGFSRNIFLEDETYTGWYIDPNDESDPNDSSAAVHWNSGYFLGSEFPFRYEAEIDSRIRGNSWSLTMAMLALSDPTFRRDFGSRQEGFDWGFLLGTGADESDTAGTTTSYSWNVAGNWSPSVPALRPWISSISISNAKTELRWRRSTIDPQYLPYPVTLSTSDSSPDTSYFAPQRWIAPDLELRVSGTIFQYPRSQSGDSRRQTSSSDPDEATETDQATARDVDAGGEPAHPSEPGEEPILPSVEQLREPWTVDTQEPEERERVTDFRIPETVGDRDGIESPQAYSTQVTYNLTPGVEHTRFFPIDDWDRPQDISLDWDYSTTESRVRGGLTWTNDIMGNWAQVRTSVSADQRYQWLGNDERLSDSERDSLLLQSYNKRRFSTDQTTTTTWRPFLWIPLLSDSTVVHTVSTDLFDYRFDSSAGTVQSPVYKTTTPEWSTDAVSTHKLDLNLRFDLLDAQQQLSLQSQLPPNDGDYSGTLIANVGPFSARISGGVEEEDDGSWSPDPIVQRYELAFLGDEVSLIQQLDQNLDPVRIDSAVTTVSLWPLSIVLNGEYTDAYEFTAGQGWAAKDTPAFRWTSVALDLDARMDESRAWRNRIEYGVFGQTKVDFDLLRVTNSSFSINYGLSLDVHDFVELDISASSRNDSIYVYVPALAEQLGRESRNLFADLADSFRFGSDEARRRSFFNIQSISVTAKHDLQDWELLIDYSGRPERTTRGGLEVYEWQNRMEIVVRWRPITELTREITVDNGDVLFDS